MLSLDIRDAIAKELQASAKGIPFKAHTVIKEKGLLTIEVEPVDPRKSLDESMEDGSLTWKAETEGSADIISVLPSVSVIHAFMTGGVALKQGQILYVNPPPYLKAMLALWADPKLAEGFINWYSHLGQNQFDNALAPPATFDGLRPAQIAAFRLPGWDVSYLWGPPGTGKTHTVGRLVASYLKHHPTHRVLLISSTNVAVDLAVSSVDDALGMEFKGHASPPCYRFGSRFDPKRYVKRKHLIPVKDKGLIDSYEAHLHSVPDPADAVKYLAWKVKLEELRQLIREETKKHLHVARVASMTGTYAAFQYEDLASVGKYDLIVFDEASQMGKAHAMTLAPLGRRALFAGDPKQLSPIVQAKDHGVDRWLGQSAFAWSDQANLKKARCLLDEQWRMAEPISRAVSELSYQGKLKVAEPALNNLDWLAHRNTPKTQLLPEGNLVVIETDATATTPYGFVGYHCKKTAEIVAALVVDLRLSLPDHEILVLTPYRAQRRAIQSELQNVKAEASLVSTVHRAQGSERRIVIFDPVRPSADFVKGEEGMRLMNVAFSRAQARLIVILQSDWKVNSALNYLVKAFPPVRVSDGALQKLLLQKLPMQKVTAETKPSPPQQSLTKPAPPVTLAECFHDELYSLLLGGPQQVFKLKQSCLDLRGKMKYKNLPSAEKDQITDAVLKELNLPTFSQLK